MRVPAVDALSVFVGAAAGTAVRYTLSQLFPAQAGLPVTMVINVTGAFLLGALSARAAGWSARRAARLTALLGTGVLGGYTTYGMFAVDTDGLLDMDRFGQSVAYGLATVVLGLGACLVGARAAGGTRAPVDRVRPPAGGR